MRSIATRLAGFPMLTIGGTFAITAMLSGCMMLGHALTPKIPVSPNLRLQDGRVWARANPINLSGTWVDAVGGRVSITETQGYGAAEVLSEETKFLWSAGEVSLINRTVTIGRDLAGDRVDKIRGSLGYKLDEKQRFVLTIDFGPEGVWAREGGGDIFCDAVRSDGSRFGLWHDNGTPLEVNWTGTSGLYQLAADPSLGWTSGELAFTSDSNQISVTLSSASGGAGGTESTQPAELTVGPAFTPGMIEEANRAAN